MKQPISESTLSDRDLKFLQIGRAAAIPGIQFALDILAEHRDLIKTEMYAIQDLLAQRSNQAQPTATVRESLLARELPPPMAVKRGPGRPKKVIGGMKGYWASMTQEERSAEMKRRHTMRLGAGDEVKKERKLHPRDTAHPDHKKWLAKMSKAVRKQWQAYSPAERKQRIQKTLAGRGLAQAPTVILERTA